MSDIEQNVSNQWRSVENAAVFAQLCSPFDPSEVKTKHVKYTDRRTGQDQWKEFDYVTARAVMNRLDDYLGPENWWVRYEFFGNSGVQCHLSVRFPSGAVVTKCGVGGIDNTKDPSDAEKSGESDALKRAAVCFGVFRYGYLEGVPEFVRDAMGAEQVAAMEDYERAVAIRGGRLPQGSTYRPSGSTGGHVGPSGAPKNGRAMFAWIKKMEESTGELLVDKLNAFMEKASIHKKIVDMDEKECLRCFNAIQKHLSGNSGTSDKKEPTQQARRARDVVPAFTGDIEQDEEVPWE